VKRSAARVLAGIWLAAALPGDARQAAPYPELRPVDEAAQEPEFFTFRAHLQAAIARRDDAAVLAVVSPTIRNTFGDDDGRAAFEKMWRLDRPDSELWEKLGAVLSLGGSFDATGNFIAPYTFSRWPGAIDSFEHVAVVGARVIVRASPSTPSAALASLSFAVVPVARDSKARPVAAAEDWTAVRLSDGRTGYVANRYVRSPIDYRAIFARVDGDWRLITFIAGD
jgi:hypothetical protein